MDREAHDGAVVTTGEIESSTALDVDELVSAWLDRHGVQDKRMDLRGFRSRESTWLYILAM